MAASMPLPGHKAAMSGAREFMPSGAGLSYWVRPGRACVATPGSLN